MAFNGQVLRSSGRWSLTTTVPAFSRSTGPTSRATATCAPLSDCHELMSWSVDFLAKTSVSLETARDWLESAAACGENSIESWASFDHATSSWRTSQRSLFEDWDVFSAIWPFEGSMRNGRVFQRAPLVHHTHDDECSLWPTPTASMDGRGFGIPLHEHSGRYKRSTVSRIQELVTEHGWRIHPHFTETLMGFPIGWSAIEPSATACILPLQNGSRGESLQRNRSE